MAHCQIRDVVTELGQPEPKVAQPALRSTDRLRKQMVVDQADPH